MQASHWSGNLLFCFFLFLVSYLSQSLLNKSPNLLKDTDWPPFLFIMVIIADIKSVNLALTNPEIELIKSLFWEFFR